MADKDRVDPQDPPNDKTTASAPPSGKAGIELHMAAASIEKLAHEKRHFPPPPEFSAQAHISSMEQYEEMYKRSIEDPDGFWAEMAGEHLEWTRKWDQVLEYDFDKPEISWFRGGQLNVSTNCLDRHLGANRHKAALVWEADSGYYRTYTYQQLHREVNRFANVLKKHGIGKGDRVSIYLPMIPELAISMLACARIGAIHSVVFGGFSAGALADRINDCGAKLLITSDVGKRGGKVVPVKANSDEALRHTTTVETVIVAPRVGEHGATHMLADRDVWWNEEMAADDISDWCEPEVMEAEDPLFILYTSGSTGKPKGVLHTTAGYLLYSHLTFKWIFDYHEDEMHFCTADIGWITGHTYVVYGPLSNGGTSLMFEGVPTYPGPDRFWKVVEKHGVNILYTAPTVIRSLMREGDDWVDKYPMTSLRLLGSVGEPINPEAWIWYHQKVGKGKLPIVDTWWQTETGGILITPLPGAMTLKPGSANKPFFGVAPQVVSQDGSSADVNEGGFLVIDRPWPGMLRGMWGDPEQKRMKEVYFEQFPGKYVSGDGASMDEEGDFWLMGRIDDVVKVSGHRLGTAEIESALVSYPAVSEAAVVGFPHDIKGEAIYAYVTLKEGSEDKAGDDMIKLLRAHVQEEVGPIAKPDKIQFAPGLPKTRSGKIMRRILRKIAAGETSPNQLGDTSTLADPSVVDDIVAGRL